MYSTAALGFASSENGYLMAANSLMRGIYLIFLFPKIVYTGRRWLSAFVSTPCLASEPATNIVTLADGDDEPSSGQGMSVAGREFDLLFLRWSLVMDGLITASTAFATKKWHIYLGEATLMPTRFADC